MVCRKRERPPESDFGVIHGPLYAPAQEVLVSDKLKEEFRRGLDVALVNSLDLKQICEGQVDNISTWLGVKVREPADLSRKYTVGWMDDVIYPDPSQRKAICRLHQLYISAYVHVECPTS